MAREKTNTNFNSQTSITKSLNLTTSLTKTLFCFGFFLVVVYFQVVSCLDFTTANISQGCRTGFNTLASNSSYVLAFENVTKYFNSCLYGGLESLTGDYYASCDDYTSLYKQACKAANASFCHTYYQVTGNGSWTGPNGILQVGVERMIRFDTNLCLPTPCENKEDLLALSNTFNDTLCNIPISLPWKDCAAKTFINCKSVSVGDAILIGASCLIAFLLVIGGFVLRRMLRKKKLKSQNF